MKHANLTMTWPALARHVQTKLQKKNLAIDDSEIIHLTALAIVVEQAIEKTDDHETIFQTIHQIERARIIHAEQKQHDWVQCRRENESKQCALCESIHVHIQQLRFDRARFTMYESCYDIHTPQTRPLLYNMAILYVLLRDASQHQIDLYLFLQTAYSLVELHKSKMIFMTQNTKNRYFVLWLMFFIRFYTDFRIIFQDWHANVPFPDLRTAWVSLIALIGVRGHTIASKDLYLDRHPKEWKSFVAQINRTHAVVQLRQAFQHTPFLFNLDVDVYF